MNTISAGKEVNMKKPPQPTNIRESLLGGAKAPKGMAPKKPDVRGRVQPVGKKNKTK
jgi:hypothetical protein